MAADLSTIGQWIDKNPSDKIADGKSLWDQPGVQAAMRAAMGENYFVRSQKEMNGPEIRWPAMERVFSPHGRAIPMIAAAIR